MDNINKWKKKIGDVHICGKNTTICGIPMLGNNYALEEDEVNCKNCLEATKLSRFETDVQDVKLGVKESPKVSMGDKNIDFFAYQLLTHHGQLKLMSKGISFKNFKLRDLKEYYGLKGKSAKECLIQFEIIKDKYLNNK